MRLYTGNRPGADERRAFLFYWKIFLKNSLTICRISRYICNVKNNISTHKSKAMTADEKVSELTDIQDKIDELLSAGVNQDDPRITRLQKDFDRIDALPVSDRVKRDDPGGDEIVIV